MLPNTLHIVDARISDRSSIEPRKSLLAVKIRKSVTNDFLQCVPVLRPQRVTAEALIRRKLRLRQHILAKVDPFPLILDSQHDGLSVTSLKWSIGIDGSVGCTSRCWSRRIIESVVHGEPHPLDHAFQHGNIDSAALTILPTLQQRRKNIAVCVHSRRDIGNGDTHFGGLFTGTCD